MSSSMTPLPPRCACLRDEPPRSKKEILSSWEAERSSHRLRLGEEVKHPWPADIDEREYFLITSSSSSAAAATAAPELNVSADVCVQVGVVVQTIAGTSRARVGHTAKPILTAPPVSSTSSRLTSMSPRANTAARDAVCARIRRLRRRRSRRSRRAPRRERARREEC